MKPKKLLIDLLELEADTQSRVELSQETIAEYTEVVKDLPPIDVFFDGDKYFIADGWHRAYAWLKADVANIPAFVHDGTQRDAILFAAAANKSHGLKRSNRDKRRSVEIMVTDAEWSTWTNGRIAEHCGVGDDLVADVRRQVSENDTSEADDFDDESDEPTTLGLPSPPPAAPPAPQKRVGRDGKSYPVKPTPAAPKGPNIGVLQAPYRRACNDLTRIKKDLKALSQDEKTGGHLASKIVRIERDLDDLRATIGQSEPAAVCGKCAGAGCQHCARTGFWTRMTVDSLKK